MKIEIDLNDILGDEFGAETLQQSVKRQVVEHLTRTVKAGVEKQIDEEVTRTINETLKTALADKMPSIVSELLDAEYTPVDRWGDLKRDQKTTFRKELIKSIHEQMKYEKNRYDSDKNAFTRAVDDVVTSAVDSFKKEYNKLVDTTFTQSCFEYAQKKMSERLGIK